MAVRIISTLVYVGDMRGLECHERYLGLSVRFWVMRSCVYLTFFIYLLPRMTRSVMGRYFTVIVLLLACVADQYFHFVVYFISGCYCGSFIGLLNWGVLQLPHMHAHFPFKKEFSLLFFRRMRQISFSLV